MKNNNTLRRMILGTMAMDLVSTVGCGYSYSTKAKAIHYFYNRTDEQLREDRLREFLREQRDRKPIIAMREGNYQET